MSEVDNQIQENEIKERIKIITESRIYDQMKRKAFSIPIFIMTGSLVFMLAGKKRTLNRSKLFTAGLGVLGGIVGGQISALWMKHEYSELDPTYSLYYELIGISKDLKKLRSKNC
jgi:hypothetical protein